MEDELFVPSGHFYSPIPSHQDAEYANIERRNGTKYSSFPGILLDQEKMEKLWLEIAPLIDDIPFTDNKCEKFRYYYNNDMYSYGDASIYYGIFSRFAPKRIIEIGSGFSSALALDMRELKDQPVELAFIEPYPNTLNSLLTKADKANVILHEKRVQDVSIKIYDELDSGDILFVDSSHVAKAGSDVCFEIFQILPQLKQGVIVHFHDVFWPFEYPQRWLIDENRGWNELYFLRAFMMYNEQFEIMFFNDYFAKHHRPEILKFDTPFLKNPGGGLWLRRR